MQIVDINFGAVLLAAIVSFALGAVWYLPQVFGKRWAELANLKTADIQTNPVRTMAWSAIVTLLTAYILAHFVKFAEATTFINGLITGGWVWLGFVATSSINNVLFRKTPFQLFQIETLYQLVSLALMGGILAIV